MGQLTVASTFSITKQFLHFFWNKHFGRTWSVWFCSLFCSYFFRFWPCDH